MGTYGSETMELMVPLSISLAILLCLYIARQLGARSTQDSGRNDV